jgi:hypothetical protein
VLPPVRDQPRRLIIGPVPSAAALLQPHGSPVRVPCTVTSARPAHPKDFAHGTRVAPLNVMLPEPESHEDLPEGAIDFPEELADDAEVHRFTVQRGMAVALVIETRDWYSGLLQAAMARVRIEGQN